MSEKLNKILLKTKKEYITIDNLKTENENSVLNTLAEKLFCGNCIVEFNTDALTTNEAIILGKKLKQLCAEFDSLLIIKDRADIAFAINANGIILDKNSIDIHNAKHILGENTIIGYSINSLENRENISFQNIDFLKISKNSNINVNIPIFHNSYSI